MSYQYPVPPVEKCGLGADSSIEKAERLSNRALKKKKPGRKAVESDD